jgi:hypothetical protein
MEFTFDDVETMLAAAMRPGSRLKQPGREQVELLRLMTNWILEGVEATREMRAEIAVCDSVASALGILSAFHRHLATRCVDVTGIEAVFGEYLDGLRRLAPILADREGAAATIDDCGLGETPGLAENLALACRIAFSPANGASAPSLKSDSAATRYAGIVITKLTGEETTGDAVKQHHLRIEKWRAKWRVPGTKT